MPTRVDSPTPSDPSSSHPLDPFPILNASAPRERRLSFILALLTYGILFLGVRGLWTRLRVAERIPPTPPPMTDRLVYLEDEPEMPLAQDTGASGAETGAGAIDPLQEESALVDPSNNPAIDMDTLPTTLPQHTLLVSMNPGLPVAVGGDGLSKGHGNGAGSGAGSGAGRGNSFLSGAKGNGPTMSIADMEVVHQVIPEYPEPARRARVEGMVILHVTINEKGVPTKVDVVSGHSMLVAETLRVMNLWRFRSVKQNGHAVSAVFSVSFLYLLENT